MSDIIININGNIHINKGIFKLKKFFLSKYLPINNKAERPIAHWDAKPPNLAHLKPSFDWVLFFN